MRISRTVRISGANIVVHDQTTYDVALAMLLDVPLAGTVSIAVADMALGEIVADMNSLGLWAYAKCEYLAGEAIVVARHIAPLAPGRPAAWGVMGNWNQISESVVAR